MPTGRLASRPIKKEAREEMAAVVVMRSLQTSATHDMCSVSETQRSPAVSLQTQVPPESETIEALTEIMYAIAACWGPVSGNFSRPTSPGN